MRAADQRWINFPCKICKRASSATSGYRCWLWTVQYTIYKDKGKKQYKYNIQMQIKTKTNTSTNTNTNTVVATATATAHIDREIYSLLIRGQFSLNIQYTIYMAH